MTDEHQCGTCKWFAVDPESEGNYGACMCEVGDTELGPVYPVVWSSECCKDWSARDKSSDH